MDSDSCMHTAIECHIGRMHCEKGELYLFHPSNPQCPSHESLWAVLFDWDEEGLLLESSSVDLQNFSRWHLLPTEYRYVRCATRDELRDYAYNLSRYDHLHCSE